MDAQRLKGEIVKNGLTQSDVASLIGMSGTTFYRRLKKGVFGTDEADKLIKLLKIEKPETIFFTNLVT